MTAATTIRSGCVRVKIFRNVATHKGKAYVRHEVRWTDHHGRRHRLKRSKFAEARKEAVRLADDLARGHHHSELSLADLATYRAALANLAPVMHTGARLENVTAEYSESRRILRAAGIDPAALPSLPDLARNYLAHRPAHIGTLTLPAAVAEFLIWKKPEVSPRYHAELKRLLAQLTAAFPGPLLEFTAQAAHRWILAQPRTTRPRVFRPPPLHAERAVAKGEKPKLAPLSPRSRNNLLRAVQTLFTLPALRSHPQREAITELSEFRTGPVLKQLWKPDEFRQLLHAAPAELLPVLVLGGFCKLRTSEIQRTRFEQLRLTDKQLLLEVGQTKTKKWRIVPIPDCAIAWLRHARGMTGMAQTDPLGHSMSHPPGPAQVWPHGTTCLYRHLREVATACGLEWRRNSLRKSACTYDELRSPDLARNAREAGNSPGVMETNYLALDAAIRGDALEWFNLYPPENTAIIKLNADQ